MIYLFKSSLLKAIIDKLKLLLILMILITSAISSAQAQQSHKSVIHQHGAPINYVGESRPNTLANIEALLNIVANGGEIFGLVLGLVLICHAIFFGNSKIIIRLLNLRLSRGNQFIVGISLMLIGLAIPCIVNYCVAGTHCGG